MEGKPKYQSETLEGVAADRFARDRAREDGEALDRVVAEAMNDAAAGRATRRSRPSHDVTPPSGLMGLFTGQRTEDPRVVRRAKARDAFYRRATALLLTAMICWTALGVTWMLTH